MNHAAKSRTLLVLFTCGLSALAMTASARTVERIAEGAIAFVKQFNGPGYVFVDKLTLEPAEVVPFHVHYGEAVNVVVQGSITLTNRCGAPRTYVAGESFVEPAELVHAVANEGSEAAVFYGHIVTPIQDPVEFVDEPNCRIRASLQPGGMGFGDQTLHTGSTRSIRLRNTGSVALPIVSIEVRGPNLAAFASSDDCGTSVPVGGSCRVSVKFKPHSAGDKSATLRVETGDHIVFFRNLTGMGVDARAH